MKISILLFAVASLIIFVLIKTIFKKKLPENCDVIEKEDYFLLLGKDSKQLFFYFRIINFRNYSINDVENNIKYGKEVFFIECDYHPRDKNREKNPKPFVFINIKKIQHSYIHNNQIGSLLALNLMRLSGILYNDCWDSHEKEMCDFAEKESFAIFDTLKKKKYL
jgi:hypothetical protein